MPINRKVIRKGAGVFLRKAAKHRRIVGGCSVSVSRPSASPGMPVLSNAAPIEDGDINIRPPAPESQQKVTFAATKQQTQTKTCAASATATPINAPGIEETELTSHCKESTTALDKGVIGTRRRRRVSSPPRNKKREKHNKLEPKMPTQAAIDYGMGTEAAEQEKPSTGDKSISHDDKPSPNAQKKAVSLPQTEVSTRGAVRKIEADMPSSEHHQAAEEFDATKQSTDRQEDDQVDHPQPQTDTTGPDPPVEPISADSVSSPPVQGRQYHRIRKKKKKRIKMMKTIAMRYPTTEDQKAVFSDATVSPAAVNSNNATTTVDEISKNVGDGSSNPSNQEESHQDTMQSSSSAFDRKRNEKKQKSPTKKCTKLDRDREVMRTMRLLRRYRAAHHMSSARTELLSVYAQEERALERFLEGYSKDLTRIKVRRRDEGTSEGNGETCVRGENADDTDRDMLAAAAASTSVTGEATSGFMRSEVAQVSDVAAHGGLPELTASDVSGRLIHVTRINKHHSQQDHKFDENHSDPAHEPQFEQQQQQSEQDVLSLLAEQMHEYVNSSHDAADADADTNRSRGEKDDFNMSIEDLFLKPEDLVDGADDDGQQHGDTNDVSLDVQTITATRKKEEIDTTTPVARKGAPTSPVVKQHRASYTVKKRRRHKHNSSSASSPSSSPVTTQKTTKNKNIATAAVTPKAISREAILAVARQLFFKRRLRLLGEYDKNGEKTQGNKENETFYSSIDNSTTRDATDTTTTTTTTRTGSSIIGHYDDNMDDAVITVEEVLNNDNDTFVADREAVSSSMSNGTSSLMMGDGHQDGFAGRPRPPQDLPPVGLDLGQLHCELSKVWEEEMSEAVRIQHLPKDLLAYYNQHYLLPTNNKKQQQNKKTTGANSLTVASSDDISIIPPEVMKDTAAAAPLVTETSPTPAFFYMQHSKALDRRVELPRHQVQQKEKDEEESNKNRSSSPSVALTSSAAQHSSTSASTTTTILPLYTNRGVLAGGPDDCYSKGFNQLEKKVLTVSEKNKKVTETEETHDESITAARRHTPTGSGAYSLSTASGLSREQYAANYLRMMRLSEEVHQSSLDSASESSASFTSSSVGNITATRDRVDSRPDASDNVSANFGDHDDCVDDAHTRHHQYTDDVTSMMPSMMIESEYSFYYDVLQGKAKHRSYHRCPFSCYVAANLPAAVARIAQMRRDKESSSESLSTVKTEQKKEKEKPGAAERGGTVNVDPSSSSVTKRIDITEADRTILADELKQQQQQQQDEDGEEFKDEISFNNSDLDEYESSLIAYSFEDDGRGGLSVDVQNNSGQSEIVDRLLSVERTSAMIRHLNRVLREEDTSATEKMIASEGAVAQHADVDVDTDGSTHSSKAGNSSTEALSAPLTSSSSTVTAAAAVSDDVRMTEEGIVPPLFLSSKKTMTHDVSAQETARNDQKPIDSAGRSAVEADTQPMQKAELIVDSPSTADITNTAEIEGSARTADVTDEIKRSGITAVADPRDVAAAIECLSKEWKQHLACVASSQRDQDTSESSSMDRKMARGDRLDTGSVTTDNLLIATKKRKKRGDKKQRSSAATCRPSPIAHSRDPSLNSVDFNHSLDVVRQSWDAAVLAIDEDADAFEKTHAVLRSGLESTDGRRGASHVHAQHSFSGDDVGNGNVTGGKGNSTERAVSPLSDVSRGRAVSPVVLEYRRRQKQKEIDAHL